MSAEEVAHDDDLGLFDSTPKGPSVKREYKGWHLPRKQVVRKVQWISPLKQLFTNRQTSATHSVIKYLGLPGADLLDLHLINSELCSSSGTSLSFLGFDTAAQPLNDDNTSLNSAYSSLVRSSTVVNGSVILADNIHDLVDQNSIAHREAIDRGPFDVINLDFCESVLGRPVRKEANAYPLLKRIFQLQNTNNEWLLLLTSRVDSGSFSDEALENLLPLTEESRENCEGFEEAIASYLSLSAPLSVAQARAMSPKEFFTLVALMSGRWLLQEAATHNKIVHVESVLGYQVFPDADTMDMLSLAVRISPNHSLLRDGSGMVNGTEFDPCPDAVKIAVKVGNIKDVDEYLANDSKAVRKFVGESAVLMKSANHELDKYFDFLEEHGYSFSAQERLDLSTKSDITSG